MLKDPTRVDAYLNKCLYVVYMGNDDYINNYFLPQFYPTSHQYTPKQFAASLIQQFYGQLKVSKSEHNQTLSQTGQSIKHPLSPMLKQHCNQYCTSTYNDSKNLLCLMLDIVQLWGKKCRSFRARFTGLHSSRDSYVPNKGIILCHFHQ